MSFRSIGSRFVRDVTLAIVMVMAVFGFIFVQVEKDRAETRLDSRNVQIVEQLQIVLAKALWNMNREQVEKIVHAYLVDEDVVSIRVFEGDTTMSHHGRVQGEIVNLLEADGGSVDLSGTRTSRAAIFYEEDAEAMGSVEVVISRQSVKRQLRNTAVVVAGSVLVLVFIEGLLLLWLIRQRVIAPLDEMVLTAERIADGDLGYQEAPGSYEATGFRHGPSDESSVPGSPEPDEPSEEGDGGLQAEPAGPEGEALDEIGTLAASFGRMTSYLREMAGVAERISIGDLSRDVTPRSENDTLGTAFQRMTSSLREVEASATAIADGDLELRLQARSEDDSLGIAFENMSRYLQEMAATAERIAVGDLGADLRPRSDRDVLGRAFQDMSHYLQEVAGVATAIAGGDLRRTFHPRGSADVLGSSFKKMEFLRQTMTQIVQGSEQLGAASDKLGSISERMAFDAERVSAQVQVVSSNSSKISRNAAEVAASTGDLSQSIAGISRSTAEVMSVVKEAVEAATNANQTITRLARSSEEIGDIIQVITGIAKQTNMLALNAEIQAARAGAAGKGFVIVANRIKELAEKTRDSTDDITRRIEAIQGASQEATDAIDQVSIIVGHVHEISRNIAGSVQVQNITTEEISSSIAEAATESEAVTSGIIEVEEVSSNAAEEAAAVQEASRQLGAVADQLRQLVERFRI